MQGALQFLDKLRSNNQPIRILTNKPTINATALKDSNYGMLVMDFLLTYTGLQHELVKADAKDNAADGVTIDNGIFNRTTGRWSGALGYLQRGEADVVLDLLSMSNDRLFHFTFLPAVTYLSYGFHISNDIVNNALQVDDTVLSIITYDRTLGALKRIFEPFLYQVWLGIMAAFVAVVMQYMVSENLFKYKLWSLPSTGQHHSWKKKKKMSKVKQTTPAWAETEKTTARVAELTAKSLVLSISEMLGPLINQGPTLSPATRSSQVIISTWCLYSVLITALYSANLMTIFIAPTPSKTPFYNISSLYKSGYRVLVLPSSSSEQFLRNLVVNLKGTEDGTMLAEVIRYSEPFWFRQTKSRNYSSYLRGRVLQAPQSENDTVFQTPPQYNVQTTKFALLSASDTKDGHQTKRCDLRTHKFSYPFDTKATTLVTIPERPLSFAMRQGSPFIDPLSQAIQFLETRGILKLLKLKQWKTKMEQGTLSNGERYQCADGPKAKPTKEWGGALELRSLLPSFTLLALCCTAATLVFACELLVYYTSCLSQRDHGL